MVFVLRTRKNIVRVGHVEGWGGIVVDGHFEGW